MNDIHRISPATLSWGGSTPQTLQRKTRESSTYSQQCRMYDWYMGTPDVVYPTILLWIHGRILCFPTQGLGVVVPMQGSQGVQPPIFSSIVRYFYHYVIIQLLVCPPISLLTSMPSHAIEAKNVGFRGGLNGIIPKYIVNPKTKQAYRISFYDGITNTHDNIIICYCTLLYTDTNISKIIM